MRVNCSACGDFFGSAGRCAHIKPLFIAAMELAELRLGELRRKLGVTQAELAERMQAAQPHLSKIENSEDFYISTLKRYIRALGGRVEIRAVFGDEQVVVGV